MAPSCKPFLHGLSRLSRASGVVPAPLAVDDAQSTIFTYEEFQALMRGDCEMLSASEDDTQSPLSWGDDAQFQAPLFREEAARFNAPRFSIDDLQAPLSEDDAELLAPLFCDEEIDVIIAAQQPSPRSGAPRSDGQPTKKRKSPPPPPPSRKDVEPPPVPSRQAKRARKMLTKAHLQAWHRRIAAGILKHQFRAPEPSRGRTALRCLCAELAAAGGHHPRGCCALHQDAPAGGEWMHEARGRVPGEVLVPTRSAGDSIATMTQYAHWRRGVWMPTRFYVQQRAAERRVADEQLDNEWMTVN